MITIIEQIKKISTNDYETRYPKNNKSYFDNLDENQKEEYLVLYSTYLSVLLKYIDFKCDLKFFDEIILNDSANFKAISEDDMDLYQYSCSDFLKYFYIRSNIYIERLSDKEMKFIKYQSLDVNENNYALIENFICNTLSKVILESDDSDEIFYTNFGPASENFIKPNNALILGVRFDEYYVEEGEPQEAWVIRHNTRLSRLFNLCEMLEYTLSKNMQIPVSVIKYNEFSIKDRK